MESKFLLSLFLFFLISIQVFIFFSIIFRIRRADIILDLTNHPP